MKSIGKLLANIENHTHETNTRNPKEKQKKPSESTLGNHRKTQRITITMMTFTMYCTSMCLDGKNGLKAEVVRLTLCLIIASYAYVEASLSLIAVSVFIYSLANLLFIIYLNRPQEIFSSN